VKRRAARSAVKKRRRLNGPIHGRIAELRESLGMTQVELAERVGVDKSAVWHWENGHARPDISRLSTVADALGVTVEELIDGEAVA
jgi:transcriptional regulator with XRE-family HTH domain